MTKKLNIELKEIKEYDPKITTLKGSITFFVLLFLQSIIYTLSEGTITNKEGLILAFTAAVIVASKNFIKNYPIV
ncbi:MAG: hypothetical protein KC589_07940 [Nanoarchaeota archaeon]|nr:hypothetical protein [Nanoarchaeota archaeon]